MSKNTAKGFDVGTLETQDAIEHEVLSLTGQPTGFFIKLASPHSEIATTADKQLEAKMRAFLRGIGNPRRLSPKQDRKQAKLADELVIDKLVAVTLGWFCLVKNGDEVETLETVTFGGNQVAYSPDNARAIYVGIPSLKEQIAEVFKGEANFTKT
jgi:hypothetical protein